MNDAIRVGRISSIDYKSGCADVCFKGEEDVIYSDLPFLAFEYKYQIIDLRHLVFKC